MLKLIFFTGNADLAKYIDSTEVDYICVDLEKNGKEARQAHRNTLISNHTFEDLDAVKHVVSQTKLIVRLNPFYNKSSEEIERAIEIGVDSIMLPMFKTADEVNAFSSMIAGRAKLIPLLETAEAAQNIQNIVKVPGISRIHIGLNDLHIDLGLTFMFELLINGFLDPVIETIKRSNIPFGIGGIARIGEGLVPGELVLAEHIRLGSSAVILSRTFHRNSKSKEEIITNLNFQKELKKLRILEETLRQAPNSETMQNYRLLLTQAVRKQILATSNATPSS